MPAAWSIIIIGDIHDVSTSKNEEERKKKSLQCALVYVYEWNFVLHSTWFWHHLCSECGDWWKYPWIASELRAACQAQSVY